MDEKCIKGNVCRECGECKLRYGIDHRKDSYNYYRTREDKK